MLTTPSSNANRLFVYSYQHRITGSKRLDRPDEYGSGILADDMGLGKSLTTLSNIMGSLDHARDFPKFMIASPNTVSTPSKITAKSTLVVVPSACKSLLKLVELHA